MQTTLTLKQQRNLGMYIPCRVCFIQLLDNNRNAVKSDRYIKQTQQRLYIYKKNAAVWQLFNKESKILKTPQDNHESVLY